MDSSSMEASMTVVSYASALTTRTIYSMYRRMSSVIEDCSASVLYSRLSLHDFVIRFVEFSHNIVVLDLESAETGLVRAEVNALGLHNG